MKVSSWLITLIWYQPGGSNPSRHHLPALSISSFVFYTANPKPIMSTDSHSDTTVPPHPESPFTTSIPLTTPSLTIVHFPSSLKLSSSNYLGWKTQVEAILHGLNLHKFIDGSFPPPSPPTEPTYTHWFRQDRLLFGALVSSLSPSIVPLITNATSSLEAWRILSNTYASPSRGHIKQLQHRLKNTSKAHDQPITKYMQSIKIIVDELSILDKTLDPEDITHVILTGLDQSTYKPVIDAIHARDTSISFHELHEKLINHELSLAQSTPSQPSLHQPTTAFVAHNRPSPKPWQNRNNPPPTI
ncbi:hypothetical protein E3N88_31035 [Mikania micrantha]|uniref:Retrotransposon Copia-like N-terminal domain-containing protein n=1 Tax=Mikania micrantha TaxID=192012 RepID=A0A5N6MN93_9ASTR|nr:hypothetical protein E3N88_31035 [Mikania micrantha]